MISAQQMPHVITILKKETAYLNELSSEAITYIQSQEITLKQETFNLKDFLHDEVCPLLKVKPDVTLSCKINKEQLFTFNPTALKKILINLLHNASKYTNKGSITIVANDDTIMIEDSGEGIDVLDAEKIFTPFLTLDESKNRQKSGFGLGLSIARNLAEKNNFTLYLDRDYHKGCRFILKKQ
jgi:signal transduction histidine kinase